MRKSKIRTNIDRIKLCFVKPEWLWNELCIRDAYLTADFTIHVTNKKEADGIVDRLQATLQIDEHELGTFTFTRVCEYCFFEAENKALYSKFGKTVQGESTSMLIVFLPIFHVLGLTVHSISSIELCVDSTAPIRARVKKSLRNRDLDLLLMGNRVADFNTRLQGVMQLYNFTRAKILPDGALYVQNRENTLSLRIYDKNRELQETSKYKKDRTEQWDGFLPKERVEITLKKEYLSLYITQSELESFDELLHNLCFEKDRCKLFMWGCHRLIYFQKIKDKNNIEVANLLY